ncbi:MAG: hypothetical protein J6Y32_04970 [Bacteroidales bacterium]|nr:hypothetical protein [Bacteroidales bacterium]
MKKLMLAAVLICGLMTTASLLTSCTDKIAPTPNDPELTLDALMDGTIVVLSFQVNGEEFSVPFVRVGDTYQLMDDYLTRTGEPEASEKAYDIAMEHDKAKSLLTFYVREKATGNLALTAVYDIHNNTLDATSSDSKYKVTNLKISVSNVDLANLLKGNSGTLADALVKGSKVVISVKFYGNTTDFTFINDGVFACSVTGRDAEEFQGSSLKLDGSTLIFSAENWNDPDSNLKIHFYTEKNTYKFMTVTHAAYDSHTISVNGIDITSKLTKEN